MVLGMLRRCEDPAGHRPRAVQGANLHVVHLQRDEMIFRACEDQNILPDPISVLVALVKLQKLHYGLHGRLNVKDVHHVMQPPALLG